MTAAGAHVRVEDVERLSPLSFKHINMVGRYQFALPEAIAAGAFRSLRDPTDPEEQDILLA